jgi:hypothetical protein
MPTLLPGTAVRAAKVQLALTDLVAVQRVLVLLTGRNHAVTHFEAEEAGAGRWRLTLDTLGDLDDLELLEARLLRLPAVLSVDVVWPGSLTAAG